ncbi:MAG: O-antigen ligase family protein [Candidatus Baltobacteraceae bacterium]
MVEAVAESPRGPAGLEWWLGYSGLLAIALIPALAKGQITDAPTSSPLGEVVWSVVYVLAAVRLLAKRDRTVTLLRHSTVLCALVLLMVLSTIWSVAPSVTFKNSIELVGTTIVAYYLVVYYPLRRLLDLVGLAFGTIAAVSLLIIVFAPGHGRMDWGSGAWSGVFQEKNSLGAAMVLATIALVPSLFMGTRRRKLLAGAASLLCLALLAGSRSATAFGAGLLALAFGVVALLWNSPRAGFSGRLLLVALGTATVGVCLLIGLQPDRVFELLGRSDTLTGRTDFWPYLLQAFGDQAVLGYGYNAFFGSSTGNEYLSSYVVQAGGWTPYHAHDSFLQIALDAGFVGLALLATLVLVAIVRATRYLATDRAPTAVWPLMIVLYLVIGSYTETYLANYNTFEWIFFVAALLYPNRGLRAGVRGAVRLTPITIRDTR